ncbi:hypothetical protein HDU79_003657 [Rhizoclosmatium sp. JEL0117]|nr:hypothetical protein HDU79_003657 [Rhizoclosmatium sp. JEL0117]
MWKIIGTAIAFLVAATIFSTYLAAKRRADKFKKDNPGLQVYTLLVPLFSPLRIFHVECTPLLPKWLPWLIYDMSEKQMAKGFTTEKGTDALAICDSDVSYFLLRDPALCHDIMVNRYKEIVKPVHTYMLIDIYGSNIVTTEGATWRRHRKIAGPVFGERNNALVHEASLRIANEMFAAWPTDQTALIDISEEMMQFALYVIASAGFGKDFAWTDKEGDIPAGHTLSFKTTMKTVIENLMNYVMFPDWSLSKLARTSRKEFGQYMDEMIEEAIADGDSLSPNILQALTKAAFAENESSKLTKEEIRANGFVMIVAGHETTANTLAYAFALLALHPDIQDTLYQHCVEALGGKDPEYADFSKLTYSLAVMNETLRLYPQVIAIPKYSADQTVVIGKHVLPPKTVIHIEVTAIHKNPDVWGPDVDEFKPERFLSTDEARQNAVKIGWMPFSEGPRACVGKKFSQVEFVVVLTMVIMRYRVGVPEGVSRECLLESASLFTLKPKHNVKLVFSRR